MSDPWSITARWIFPVGRPPLSNGIVVVEDDRIVAVERAGTRTPDFDLGNVAVLPGLVNAHTHLDLTGLRGQTPPGPDFTGWLGQVIAYRRRHTAEQTDADIRAGLAECLRTGTTLVGDISGDGGSWDALCGAPIRAVVFRELLGLTEERAAAALESAVAWKDAHPATPTCRPGLSPHAPYSARESLFLHVGMQARISVHRDSIANPSIGGFPLSIHLAETQAECELLERLEGPFVPFLQGLGVWDPEGLVPDVQRVINLCEQRVPLLLVHGNYLPAGTRIPGRATVVYCPRTHAAFGHSPHPFRDLMARGVRIALGTDSLASNPDLDLLGEARFLHRTYPDLPGADLLKLATLNGAEALGWAKETGSLAPGKSADLVVVRLADEEPADPHALVFASDRPVSRVLFQGRWLDS